MERPEKLCAEVNKRASSFLESGKWTDCKFVVGAEPHQAVVGAHKLVLAMASPVFEAMFYGGLADTRDFIPIVDVELEIFKDTLRYIYTGNIKLSSCDEAIHIYHIANKFMLHHLMEECSSFLQNNVDVGNVCQIYENAQLYQDEALTQKCINIFTEDTKELLQDSSFRDAALSTVEKIFSLNELNIDSEADLINAAALYVRAQDDKSVEKKSSGPGICTAPHEKVMNVETNVEGLSDTQNATDDAEQETPGSSLIINDTVNKQQIRSVVRHIRWLTLTPQQYADCTARFLLLTQLEDHAVLVNIASTKPSVPMPKGLSTCKDRRVYETPSWETVVIFRYTMQNFSNLNNMEWSPVFYVSHLPWKVAVSLKYKEGIKYLALIVYCSEESETVDWSCDANVVVTLMCHKPGADNVVEKLQCSFNSLHDNTGDLIFLPWDTVLDPIEGYIQDDSVTIEVQVAAEEPLYDIM